MTSTQVKWIETLEGEGYKAVRHFNNMLHRLDAIPEQGIPAGLEVRPVQKDHYRSTEHVFVRRPWRKRGLAKALVSRSLRVLKEQGMHEAELGVDSENESEAFEFYRRLGYETFSIDIWFRKPMM